MYKKPHEDLKMWTKSKQAIRGKYGKEVYYEEECRSQEILNNFIEENEVVLCVNCILASYSVHEFLKFYICFGNIFL